LDIDILGITDHSARMQANLKVSDEKVRCAFPVYGQTYK